MEIIKIIREPSANNLEAFVAREGDTKLGEMVFTISGSIITVYHTEVFPAAEGKGVGKKLLQAMVAQARLLKLSVAPRCIFVLAQFKRHPALYADIWKHRTIKA